MNKYMLMYRLKSVMYMIFIASMAAGLASDALQAQTGGSAGATVTSALCAIVNSVRTVIGVFALIMFIIGGTLYAFAHFLPAAGNLKGGMQGWGMGMLMGGIIALILYILAPFIIGRLIAITSITSSTGGTTISASAGSVTPALCA